MCYMNRQRRTTFRRVVACFFGKFQRLVGGDYLNLVMKKRKLTDLVVNV